MIRTALGVLATLLTSALLVAGLATTATAHADLLSSTPEDGAVLSSAPDQVVLTFSEDLLPDTVKLSVEDETGFVVRVLTFTVDGSDVLVTWPPGVPGRELGLNYRVVSQDGHPISGTVRYTVRTADAPSSVATPAEPAEPAEPQEQSDARLTVVIVGVLVIGAAVVAALLVRRRRASP